MENTLIVPSQKIDIGLIRGDYVGFFVLGFIAGFLLCLWTAHVIIGNGQKSRN